MEMQNIKNRNATQHSTTKQMLSQEDKNVKLVKKIMIIKKSIMPSFRHQNWKKVIVKTEKVN